ncbi:hypothetical protein V6N13_100473 [Hibiscus sabdariffa]|uniref:Uncharacterized protein n=2 Tax=Hibiscus sabdariffa TaxID=183260 RepID=A0ABR2BTJ8_9ROSI
MKGLNKTRTEVPEILVLEILSKLPVKSLTRFRCVCKFWSSSFQTPLFINKHHLNNLSKNNLNLLLQRCHGPNGEIHYFSQLSTEKGQNFMVKQNIHLPICEDYSTDPIVHGPCNGILCFDAEFKIGLWNPSTRQFKIFPKSSIERPPSADSTSFECLGFGYDSLTDDYKVIRFVSNSFEYEFDGMSFYSHTIVQVDLYSLKSNSWKELPDPGVGAWYAFTFNNYINGFYYWPATEASGHVILSFDMVNERFSTLPLPEFDGGLAQNYLELVDFKGSLGAIVYPREGTLKSVHVWVMSGSWTKQHSFESVPGVERPLGFWENGKVFLESSDHELVLFDPSTRELQNLGVDAYPKKMQIIVYVETLVPLNGRSELEELIMRRSSSWRPVK